jgi:hypothetical protein
MKEEGIAKEGNGIRHSAKRRANDVANSGS